MTTHDFLLPHTHYLLARARRLTRNEADARDLVQETCLHAIETLRERDTPPESPRGWLVVMLRNLWFNNLRHKDVCRTAQAEILARSSSDPSLVDTRMVNSQFARAWGQLSPQSQEIAERCLLDGESYEEVSQRFGLSAGGVASSIHRTRQSLLDVMHADAE